MSRDETHGGGTWAFPNCVWSPTEKRGEAGSWPFWSKVLAIRAGDTVLHLRGKQPNALFIGYSTASADGFETARRPPEPGEWSYSKTFYRADLESFTRFHSPIRLSDVFSSRRIELEDYFAKNKRSPDKRTIFFVQQSGRLQCLNGAYLSEIDEDLFRALFDTADAPNEVREAPVVATIETRWQLSTIKTRLGQAAFSTRIKKLYGFRCCFPQCHVSDPRFLVGSHIARWSDNEALRGNPGNGLCLCVFHDKAFELGLFTLDERYQVFINPREADSASDVVQQLLAVHGQRISLAEVKPLDDAILEHWERVGVAP